MESGSLWFNFDSYVSLFSLGSTTQQLVTLAQAGATLVDMQVAGRWKSSQMPARYAKTELTEREAIARFKDGK